MKKIKQIFLILSTINILACTNCNTKDKLDAISTYVCAYPDSAIQELNKINKSELITEQLRAQHALLLCESTYFFNRSVNDSTLNIALNFFVHNNNGTVSQQIETKLLYLYTNIYNKPSEIIYELLEMEKQIDILKYPHLKGMLESLILITYYDNHEYANMLKHAYKELYFAQQTKDINRIINSKEHIGVAYEKLNNYDSAYIYYTSFKGYENLLDSTILSTAYHNMATLLRTTNTSNKQNLKNALIRSLKYNRNREDSSRTYLQLADYYFKTKNKKLADSLFNIFYKSTRKK